MSGGQAGPGVPRAVGPRLATTDEPSPLRLADSDHGGESAAGRASASRNGHHAPGSAPASADPAASANAGSSSAGDITTGGFETVFGKIVVERGLVTADEVEACNAIIRDTAGGDSPRTLPDLLLDNEYITERQLRRLRSEFEENKSSQQIPGYKIIKRLGAGAMATVFLARQLSLDRKVAIKVLPQKFSANAKFIERFYKEGRAAAQLNHPNIVQAYDVGQAGEHHYFVMEYVDGSTVFDRIVKDKRFSEKEALDIIMQVGKALDHAHEKGFVHRDIKPKNIMMSTTHAVKLADLGLARAVSDKEAAEAEAGRAYGTPYYISPEQIRGEVNIGPQADIYGLGATFYHMVTGKVPFEGKNPSEVMHKHLKEELKAPDHVNPKLSAGCAQIIEMCMAKSRKNRYQTVKDLLQDLDLVRKGLTPHFAHKGIGLSGITSALTTPQPVVTPVVVKRPEGLLATPLGWGLLAVLVASVIGNLILAIVALT
jgi:eukaryotic-like serine/threonine-protein kinase